MQPLLATPEPTEAADPRSFQQVIDDICDRAWATVDDRDLARVLQAYYFFSVQFREGLEIACAHYPEDPNLQQLRAEECGTDNLSPWPGIAAAGERMDHDEFLRRVLHRFPLAGMDDLCRAGERYLAASRRLDDAARAKAICSYEDGGLSSVFSAILQASDWQGPALAAFRFFLEKHVEFDGEGGHGALSRGLVPDESITPLWASFEELIDIAVPHLAPRRH